MASTLFKPVYVTSSMSVQRKLDTQQNNVVDNTENQLPPSHITDKYFAENLRIDLKTPPSPSIQLSTFEIPKYVSKKVINLHSNRECRDADNDDDDSKNVYIARPYRRLMAIPGDSTCTNSRPCSSTKDDSQATDCLSTPKTPQTMYRESYPSESPPTFSSSTQIPAFSDVIEKTERSSSGNEQRSYLHCFFKSTSDCYLTVPHIEGKVQKLVGTNTNVDNCEPAKECFTPCGSNVIQSTTFARPSLRSLTPAVKDPISLVSQTHSLDGSQVTKSLQTSYCQYLSSKTGSRCSYGSLTLSDVAIVSLAENAITLNRVQVTPEVKLYVAKNSIYKEYVSPCVFNNITFHLTTDGPNSWLPCSFSFKGAKRIICSKMYTSCSVVGRFPIQFIEHQQIYGLHAEFATAKASMHGGKNTIPTLLFKSTMVLVSSSYMSKQIKEYEPIFPTQIGLESCNVWPKTEGLVTGELQCSTVNGIYRRITNGNTRGSKCNCAAVRSYDGWRNRVLFSQDPNLPNKCSTLKEKKKVSRVRSQCISESSSICQGTSQCSCSLSTTYSSVSSKSGSSNNSATANNERSISMSTFKPSSQHTHTVHTKENEASRLTIKRKNLLDVHDPSQTRPEAKERHFQRKGSLNLNVKRESKGPVIRVRSECQFSKSDTPLLDFKIVPRIPDTDDENGKPVKLNIIKGTTSLQQLFDRIASRKTVQDSRVQKDESAPISTFSFSRREYIQTKTYDCGEDNISVDSSTLIPEGHPAVGKSGSEKEEIYLSCTYVLQKPKNTPMKQLFELESSNSEKGTGEIPFEVPERDKSSEKLKSSVSDLESESKSNLQRKGLCAFNKMALNRRNLAIKNRRTFASRLLQKNTVTWASDATRASDIEKDETKPSKDASVTQDVKTESEVQLEKKPERDVSVKETQISKDPDLTVDIANDSIRDYFQLNDQSTMKEVENLKDLLNSVLERSTSKLKNVETQPKSGDTGHRLTLLTNMEKTENSQGSPIKSDSRLLKEAELQKLKKKCESLRRELLKTSPSTGDGHEALSLSPSPTTTPNTSKRLHSGRLDLRRFPKHSGRISRQLAKSKRQSHRNRYKRRHSSSNSRSKRYRNRNHEYRHWLPMPPYPMYPPPPALQAYPGYPYSPLPYYPPVPPLPAQPQLLQPNYLALPPPLMLPMMADQWAYRHRRSSHKHRHPKSLEPSRHRHHGKQKSSSRRRKNAKRTKKDMVGATSCAEVTAHSFGNESISPGYTTSFQSQPPQTNLYSEISNFKPQQLSPVPPPVLQQPQVEPPKPPTPQISLSALYMGPSGSYKLPDAVGPSFNPFKGHSLPNEPSGLVETRLMAQSPPTKSNPLPSAAFSGAVGVGRMPSVNLPPPLMATLQQPPPTNSPMQMAPPPPLPPKEPMPPPPPMPTPNTAQPPNRRAPTQNAPPRQPLSAIMGPPPKAATGATAAAPPPTAGTKVDGPQVTSTGERYGLFRLPTSHIEYQSCEKRFDWLQSEKTHLENTLNKLATDCGVAGPTERKLPLGIKESQEETRIKGALNQIGREMSALRLVMKKYANEKKKGLLLKKTTF